MSYQVLARKWRPRIFREMVGQEHVLKALINALDHKRLHHAYLFTGTRGVGKTTIARIMARCLNCEVGISSEPCGECGACREINEGRFVDLLEVDAASRTKVEDTREILDNVQYAPTRGRFKIYLIDEVHMLSNHSFNALLKTLEEPPEHVKFLLATTDPQKLPVTILSRCLQFNLKNMSPEKIVGHLETVLKEEMIPHEPAALWLLAKSADGSMRDALSLTDQAIAFSGDNVSEKDVATMLGTIDQSLIHTLIEALSALDGKKILQAVDAFAEHSPDFNAALADLLSTLHRIAIAQALPEAVDNSMGDRNAILSYARQFTPEDIQLFYQTALMGRRDLPLASDPRSGFEMTLLRMLAFRPQGLLDVPEEGLPNHELAGDDASHAEEPSSAPAVSSQAPAGNTATGQMEGSSSVKKPESSTVEAIAQPGSEAVPSVDDLKNQIKAIVGTEGLTKASPSTPEGAQAPLAPRLEPSPSESALISDYPVAPDRTLSEQAKAQPQVSPGQNNACEPVEKPRSASESAPQALQSDKLQSNRLQPDKSQLDTLALDHLNPASWIVLAQVLKVKGIIQNTVLNSVFVGREGNVLHFLLDEHKGSLFDNSHNQRIADILADYWQMPIRVNFNLGALDATVETPAMAMQRELAEKRQQAIAVLKSNPIVQALEQQFDATLLEDSIQF